MMSSEARDLRQKINLLSLGTAHLLELVERDHLGWGVYGPSTSQGVSFASEWLDKLALLSQQLEDVGHAYLVNHGPSLILVILTSYQDKPVALKLYMSSHRQDTEVYVVGIDGFSGSGPAGNGSDLANIFVMETFLNVRQHLNHENSGFWFLSLLNSEAVDAVLDSFFSD